MLQADAFAYGGFGHPVRRGMRPRCRSAGETGSLAFKNLSNRFDMVEVACYQSARPVRAMSSQLMEDPKRGSGFWDDATRYAAASNDESFVDEVAYMMVTLHRTGN